MQTALRFGILAAFVAAPIAHAQRPLTDAERRSAFGVSVLGLVPQGQFANNVDFAIGIGGSYLLKLDPDGVVGLRLDLGYLTYGSERYRAPLGSGPLALITVETTTDNNIVLGGLGVQIAAPHGPVRPYALASAGFSYFFTESSVRGTGNSGGDSFASSTNYGDGGFAWSAGGGINIPVSQRRRVVSIDLGVRYVDNGHRDYLREGGITFENNVVQLHPVRSEAKGVQFNLGVTISYR